MRGDFRLSRGGSIEMKKYAIIDFSLGSISLLIAGAEDGSQEVLFKTYVQCIISEYITHSGKLKEKGIEKICLEAQNIMKSVEKLNVEEIYPISTTLLRNLENRDEVKAAIKERTGLDPVSLSGREEAFAAYYANERYKILEKAILIDIGGSSTEICDYQKAFKEAMVSLDFGAETILAEFVNEVYPSDDEEKDIREFLEKKLSERDLASIGMYENAVLAGSNANALYKIYCDYYEIGKSDERLMQTKKLQKLVKVLMNEKKRSALILRNAPEKLHLILPTAILLKSLLTHYGISNITVSNLGVKEGWFRLQMEKKGKDDNR